MDAMDPDSVASVHLTTACLEDRVRVTVNDNGRGLSPEEIERVFEPFRTSRSGGLGLGLAISRSIVEEHGGQIWAERAEQGLSVKFTLPFKP